MGGKKMDNRHANAMNEFADQVAYACARANDKDIPDGQLVLELRRIADEMEAEVNRQMKRNRAR